MRRRCCAVALLFMIAWVPVRAEHSESAGSPAGARPGAQDSLSRKSRSLLISVFHLPEGFLRSRLEGPLKEGLDRTKSGEEAPVAGVLARMLGSLNDQQLKDLVLRVKEEKPADAREQALFSRLIWGAAILADVVGIPDEIFSDLPRGNEKFVQAFREALQAHRDRQKAFYELLERARNGDEAAKAELREKYDPEVMARFLGGQIRSGNDGVATQLAEALSEKNSAGEHFIDLNTRADDKPARLMLGKAPDSISASLRNFEKGNFSSEAGVGGFANYRISPKTHSEADLRRSGMFLRPPGSEGGGGSPTPSEGAASEGATSSSTSEPSDLPLRERTAESPSQGTVSSRPRLAVESVHDLDAEELDHAMANFVKGNGCMSCHGPEGKGAMPLFAEDGSLNERFRKKRARMLEVLNGENLPPDGKMKGIMDALGKQLSSHEKAVFGRWGREHNISDERNPFLKDAKLEPGAEPAEEEIAVPESIDEARERNLFTGFVEPADLAAAMVKAKNDPQVKLPRLWSLGVVDPPLQGSEVIGGSFDDVPYKGLDELESGPHPPAKDEEIVIYCGCCAVEHCPNVLAALPELKKRGYTNIKVLNLKESYWQDWEEYYELDGTPKKPAE